MLSLMKLLIRGPEIWWPIVHGMSTIINNNINVSKIVIVCCAGSTSGWTRYCKTNAHSFSFDTIAIVCCTGIYCLRWAEDCWSITGIEKQWTVIITISHLPSLLFVASLTPLLTICLCLGRCYVSLPRYSRHIYWEPFFVMGVGNYIDDVYHACSCNWMETPPGFRGLFRCNKPPHQTRTGSQRYGRLIQLSHGCCAYRPTPSPSLLPW